MRLPLTDYAILCQQVAYTYYPISLLPSALGTGIATYTPPRPMVLREFMNPIINLASSHCAWSLRPLDLLPSKSVQDYFCAPSDGGLPQTS